ncbi:MAG TPA: hypothetical protein VMS17_27380 [Gemmataceae bacterium]|nr:hypothetical protein [Gemmataceae bacterium]
MRRAWAGMTAAILFTLAAASAATAQDADGDLHSAAPKPKMWWDGWFGPAAKPPDKKHDDEQPSARGPSQVDLVAAARQRERADWDRRSEVCDRLMAIASSNNDEAMLAEIEQLRNRAWDIYQQRTAALSGAAAPPDDKPAKPKHTLEVKP